MKVLIWALCGAPFFLAGLTGDTAALGLGAWFVAIGFTAAACMPAWRKRRVK